MISQLRRFLPPLVPCPIEIRVSFSHLYHCQDEKPKAENCDPSKSSSLPWQRYRPTLELLSSSALSFGLYRYSTLSLVYDWEFVKFFVVASNLNKFGKEISGQFEILKSGLFKFLFWRLLIFLLTQVLEATGRIVGGGGF